MKIFDLKNGSVITAFPNTLSAQEVIKKVNDLKQSQKCRLAPRILHSNIEKRYVVEEFVRNGKPIAETEGDSITFIKKLFSVLSTVNLTTTPQKVNYNKFIFDKWHRTDVAINSIRKEDRNSNYHTILEYLQEIKSYLEAIPVKRSYIYTVFSHGDFWEGNILVEKDKYHVIDWNTVGYRTLYFDFYYVLFMIVSKNKHFDTVDVEGLEKLSTQLKYMSELFKFKLEDKGYDIIIENDFRLYRYLFYLELLLLKMEDSDGQFAEAATWVKRFDVMEKSLTYQDNNFIKSNNG